MIINNKINNKKNFWLLLIFLNLKLFSSLNNNQKNSKKTTSTIQSNKSNPKQVTNISNDVFNTIKGDSVNKSKLDTIKNKTAETKIAKEEKNTELSQFESSIAMPLVDQECKKNHINLNSQTCNDIKKQVDSLLNNYVFAHGFKNEANRTLNTTKTIIMKDLMPVATVGIMGHQIKGAFKKEPKNSNLENSINSEKEALNAEKASEMSAETSASSDAVKAESSLDVADGAALGEGAVEGVEVGEEVAEDLLI